MRDGEDNETRVELARTVAVGKRFGAIAAVSGVSCSFHSGEIHAVCGENGAGKSTLLKLVAGMIVPDAGETVVDGSRLVPHTPREAIRRGVAMVLQHFALVPVFTALENIILGAEPTRALGALDGDAARSRALKIAAELGVDLPLDSLVEDLGVGDRQRIEIARALFRDARLVILDEPTAVLTKTEATALYATLKRLAERGKGIVVVTHKMDEVRMHADVVSVMRRGELVFTRPLDRSSDVSAQVDAVAAAIMGAERQDPYRGASQIGHASTTTEPASGSDAGLMTHEARAPEGRAVLVMSDVEAGALKSASLSLRAGEIVGIAGVEGNGQKELVDLLAGELAPARGSLVVGSTAIIREDRQTEGLVLDASLRDNLLLGELDRFSRWGVLQLDPLEKEASARLERSGALRSVEGQRMGVGGVTPQVEEKRSDLDRAARTLSGGNQQKLVVARALARDAKVVVAAQPTRGVDLAASREIHRDLVLAAKRGAGVLVISADLDELRALASRILVLVRGAIVAELPPTATDDELGRVMLGLGTHKGADEDPQARASA